MGKYALGFDFGGEWVRVVVIDILDGRIAGQAAAAYAHGVISDALPTSGEKLPGKFALQHPRDWLDALATACKSAVRQSGVGTAEIIGIGVAFTSCTMLPCRANGTPLCLLDEFSATPHAWPKLWNHRAATAEARRITDVARERSEAWLARYGGRIDPAWFFPKALETLIHAPRVYAAAHLFIEAGDWLVWQLTTGLFPRCDPATVVRSTCQAGYKAQWNAHGGFPSRDFFRAVEPRLENVVEKVRGEFRSPGRQAGGLSADAAALLGLRDGIVVSAAVTDTHARVPGAGVASPSTMILALGARGGHLLNSRVEQFPPGIAGVVEDGILPGYFGYETAETRVGDALAWLVETFRVSHDDMIRAAQELPPGSGGVIAIDGFGGGGGGRARPENADGAGALVGVTLATQPAQLYRALLEAAAFAARRTVETIRAAGVPVRRFVATGDLAGNHPLLMQVFADVLNEKITLAASEQPAALGAAILGCLAAGEAVTGYPPISQAIHAMARQRPDLAYRPDLRARKLYDGVHALYRQLADERGPVAAVMRAMKRS